MLAETQTFSIIDTTLNHWDWIVIGFYFAFITGIGFLFKHVNKDASDYFRSGGNMLWRMAVAAVVAASATVYGDTIWTGTAGNNDWNTPGNWSAGVPISTAKTIITNTANITMSGTGTTKGVDVGAVGTSMADAAVLNITKDLTNGTVPVVIGQDLNTSSTSEKYFAKVVHTSGALKMNKANGTSGLIVARADSTALYVFGGAQGSAPTIEAHYLQVGVGGRSRGTMSLKDYGTITLGNYVYLGGNNSAGELRVEGGNLNINIGGNFQFGPNSTTSDYVLRAVLTDDTTFSTINVGGDVLLGTTTTNLSKFYLELDDSYEHVLGRTYTILQSVSNFYSLGVTAGKFSNVTNNQMLVVGGHEFRANYDYTAGANKFELTAIPEPVTGLLFSILAKWQSQTQAVLALNPVGYWPADEGGGETLHDRSANQNHGKIYHTPWRDGMLDFTSAFQWCQIPFSDVWQGEGLSVGGWLFIRNYNYRRNGMLFMGLANPIRLWVNPSLILRVRDGMELEVVSDGMVDAIGSLAGKDVLAVNEWQHVLYTWKDGTANLYLNGKLVRSAENVPGELRKYKYPLIIGSDADWWMLAPPGSSSLNGSVRDLVLFNRALSVEEITQLQTATRPSQTPWLPSPHAMIIDGQEVPLAELGQASVDTQFSALTEIAGRDTQSLQAMAGELQPVLVERLDAWPTCVLAAELLLKLDGDSNRPLLQQRMEPWTRVLSDANAPDEERAASALALATLKAEAKSAVPVLADTLQELLGREGMQPLRVDDLLRNALIRALLDIDPGDEKARAVLGQALAKPILNLVDLSQPYLAEVKALMDDERYMDAFFAFALLKPRINHGEFYFTQGDANRDARGSSTDRAYSPIATRDGITYTLGAGKAFDGVEPITPDEFQARLVTIVIGYPEAETWRDPAFTNLYRVKIRKTMPDGTEETSYLAGEDFIFDGSDAKVKGWSVGIDTAGYLHIVGGQHNAPNPNAYIPGSWERLGLSRDKNSESFPSQMYFVSKRPGDITEFEFVGTRNNPRNIPAGYLNYMNWVQDNAGEMFLYGRIDGSGWQSWGMFHYDGKTRRWTPIGGDACDIIADALATEPEWKQYLHTNVRGSIPTKPGPKTLVWAWQPHFYNYCRDAWGIYFDKTNRMHLRMQIRGLDENGRIVDARVYAWSDDLGQTFHRADGAPVALPLTVNPAPNHNANNNSYRQRIYWELYQSLLSRAGF